MKRDWRDYAMLALTCLIGILGICLIVIEVKYLSS